MAVCYTIPFWFSNLNTIYIVSKTLPLPKTILVFYFEISATMLQVYSC